MIKRELQKRSHHYILLIVGEAILFSSFVFVKNSPLQSFLAVVIGLFYFLWGVFTHQKEIKTFRLMLEYAVVGMLATVMLLSLLQRL